MACGLSCTRPPRCPLSTGGAFERLNIVLCEWDFAGKGGCDTPRSAALPVLKIVNGLVEGVISSDREPGERIDDGRDEFLVLDKQRDRGVFDQIANRDRRGGESSIHRGTGKRQDELQQNFGNDQKQSTESNRKRTHTKLFKMDAESRYK